MLATSSEKKRYQDRFQLTHATSCYIRQPAVNFWHLPVTEESRNVSYANDSLGAGNGHCSEKKEKFRKQVKKEENKEIKKGGKQEREE